MAAGSAPPNPHAWLIRAVIFRSRHLARGLRRRRNHESLASLGRPEASLRDEASRQVTTDEVYRVLIDLLSSLGEDYREVLSLQALEELSYEAISQAVGIPVGTVRSRLSRSRQAFRKLLEREHPEVLAPDE